MARGYEGWSGMSKTDLTAFDGAIAALPEVVFDPGAWPAVMDRLCSAVGSTGAVLLQSNVRTSDVPRTKSVDGMITYYFENNWHNRDLRARGTPLLFNGRTVITDQDCVTHDDEMRRSAYYNECVYGNGFHWFAGVGFRAADALWVMACHRAKGVEPFNREEIRILERLSPHLTATATLSKTAGQAILTGAASLLDEMNEAAVAIDRSGRVLRANACAEALFDETFRVRNGRLSATEFSSDTALTRLVECIAATPPEKFQPSSQS